MRTVRTGAYEKISGAYEKKCVQNFFKQKTKVSYKQVFKVHVFPYSLTKLQTSVVKVDCWCFVGFPVLKGYVLLSIICFVSLLELKQRVKMFLTRYTPSLVERVMRIRYH